MPGTVYIISPDDDDRLWIDSTLASAVDDVVFVDDGEAMLAHLPVDGQACLVASAEPDTAATLNLVRSVRQCDPALPIIVLGSHSAFRMAVDIARLPATDFLERPVSQRQLRSAVAKALKGLQR